MSPAPALKASVFELRGLNRSWPEIKGVSMNLTPGGYAQTSPKHRSCMLHRSVSDLRSSPVQFITSVWPFFSSGFVFQTDAREKELLSRGGGLEGNNLTQSHVKGQKAARGLRTKEFGGGQAQQRETWRGRSHAGK